MDCIKKGKEGIYVLLKAYPNSQNKKLQLTESQELKVYMQSSPDKNKANQELISYMSNVLKVPKSKITLTKGHTSRQKTLFISEISKAFFLKLILEIS